MSEWQIDRRELGSIRRFTPAEARDLVEGGGGVLVDTRDRRFYDEAHVVGALSVPFAEIRRSPEHGELRSIPQGQRIILYCA